MATMNELPAARTFLRRNFPQRGRVLCAVSGGLDSMCLLHFMTRQPGFTVAAAHFNHRLRGLLADRDEAFVRGWCAARGIPFFAGAGDTRAFAAAEGRSIEEAARTLRYAFLEQTAEAEGFAAVLTAHHADDNAETMLLNLIRGAGTAGLTGIPPRRGIICRPFLRISRKTLAAYGERHGLSHAEDETNQEDAAARNVLRHQVFPVLRELNSRAVENMSFTASVLARENAALEWLARDLAGQAEKTGNGLSIVCGALLEAPPPVAERAVLQLLAMAAGVRKDLASAHVEAVLELAERGRNGAEASLPYGLTACRRANRLEIARRLPLEPAVLEQGRPLRWGGYTLTLLDRRIGTGLALCPGGERVTVGPCIPGAGLALPGGNGKRSVKRLCLDRGVGLSERESLPAIFVNGHLAAVWRLGVDAEFLPEGEACRFIQIIKHTEENRP